MPVYAIRSNHESNNCPSTNSRVRDFAQRMMGGQMPKLMGELNVRFVLEPLHLDPGHEVIAVAEADSIETVCRLVQESGLAHFNNVQVYPTTPVAELMQRETEMLYD
jgi:hypothetical protein